MYAEQLLHRATRREREACASSTSPTAGRPHGGSGGNPDRHDRQQPDPGPDPARPPGAGAVAAQVRRELGVVRDDSAWARTARTGWACRWWTTAWCAAPWWCRATTPPLRYSDDDQVLLAYVAQHILTALARRDAQEELERRVERAHPRAARTGDASASAASACRRRCSASPNWPAAASMEVFYAEVHGIVSELLDARNFYIALLPTTARELDFPYFAVDEDATSTKRPRRRRPRACTEYVLALGPSRCWPTVQRPGARGRLVPRASGSRFGTPVGVLAGRAAELDGSGVRGAMVVQSYTPGVPLQRGATRSC